MVGSQREIVDEPHPEVVGEFELAPVQCGFEALKDVLLQEASPERREMFHSVTETLFQWPGMGSLLLTSIYESDRPVIVTYIMLAALIILTINIIVDILYAYLNPKIRYG